MSSDAVVTPEWVNDPSTIHVRLGHRPARIGMDTEFIRERTYWPQLALVQIAYLDPAGVLRVLLIDPLPAGMADALAPILADTGILKIMHSPSEDLVALRHTCGEVPRPVFDTQAAAALAGIGAGVGYQKLVEQLTGIALEKGETRSDWLRRPLSAAQLEYAADDVRHLFDMTDALDGLLAPLGRRAWVDEDAARTVLQAQGDTSERWPHMSLRSAQFIDRAAQLRLLRLLRWRERQARSGDRPKTWVLDNELAVAIARQAPSSAQALETMLDAHPKAPRKLASAIFEALHVPLDDESDAPDAARGEARDKQRLRKLQDIVAARAAELAIPDGTLASRRWLEALLDDGEWPAALSGWRRQILEAEFTAALQ